MTKKRATEILNELLLKFPHGLSPNVAADALDRAGAFPREETAAEIDTMASRILINDCVGWTPEETRQTALRLASACHAAKLV